MSDRSDLLSSTAVLLLGAHRPGEPAYHSWALGLPGSPNGLGPIDEAYDELVERGFLEPAGLPVPVLPGVVRDSFVLTASALDEGRAAPTDDAADGLVDILPRDYPAPPESVDLPADGSSSVDLPATLPVRSPAAPAPMSFRQAVRVGLGLGVGFWAVGLTCFAIVALAMSLFGGPGRTPGIPVAAPAGASLAVAPGTPP